VYFPQIFETLTANKFKELTLRIFHYQSVNNVVYADFIKKLGINSAEVKSIDQIPYLPIQFFKTHQIISGNDTVQEVFLSSGTTGLTQSKHFVTNTNLYVSSFTMGFEYFYGAIETYTILALLPNYLEQKNSSLVFMVNELIKKSNTKESGFYLNNLEELSYKLIKLDKKGKKVMLIGVSYALLDLIELNKFNLKNTIVLETGGMKGRRKEMIKEELHQVLCKGFGLEEIHSEYGMTELLSQAYSHGNGIFKTPPWMKIVIRDAEDALQILPVEKAGGMNVIDLANFNSCSFIATQDLGKTHKNQTFEILGRFDNSDIRGCNLMVV
jgi:hypothetical protein